MKENSIEKDIKILETWLEELNELFNKNHINNTKERNALYNILSDYKRVLKENEKYKRLAEMNLKNAEEFKENMCDHRCLLKSENEELKNKLSLKQFDINVVYNDYLEKLNEYKENSISIQKVKDKIEKYKKLSDKFYVKFLESNRYNTDIREKGIKCDAIILALEELIGEREDK